MKPLSIRLFVLIGALAGLAQGRARADQIDFSYHWTVQPASVITGGTGSVQFSVAPDPTTPQGITLGNTLPTLIPAATVLTASGATNPPDTFSTKPFSLSLTLTDTASGQSNASNPLVFAGTINGSLTQNTSSLTSTFASGSVTQTVTLGGHQYTVTIDPSMVSLPDPTSGSAVIDALVTAVNATGGGTTGGGGTSNAPEPSGLVLAATAVLGLAARRFRRSLRGAA
jgi:hypothetical protein